MKAVMIILMLAAGMDFPTEKVYEYENITECRSALVGMKMTEKSDAGAIVAFCRDK